MNEIYNSRLDIFRSIFCLSFGFHSLIYEVIFIGKSSDGLSWKIIFV